MAKRKNNKEEPLLTSSDNGDRIEVTIPNKPGERVMVIKIPLSKKEKEVAAEAGKKERHYKQPRALLKTAAKLVGKASEPTLFSLAPPITEPGQGDFLREVISKNTAILAYHLMDLYERSRQPTLVIRNLSSIAETLNNTNYEIKIYLLHLGGYTYPVLDINEEGGISLAIEQLFKVEFRYSKEIKEKFSTGELTLVGTDLAQFIKDEPVDSIHITPNQRFIDARGGKGLGNVLVNEKIVKLALGVTDIAFKILSYSASGKPAQAIAEDNLIVHLGLEKQVKTQGRPRIRQTILKGLQELKDWEHITSYSYEEDTSLYRFTYSEKYVSHKDHKREK